MKRDLIEGIIYMLLFFVIVAVWGSQSSEKAVQGWGESAVRAVGECPEKALRASNPVEHSVFEKCGQAVVHGLLAPGTIESSSRALYKVLNRAFDPMFIGLSIVHPL
jgi:hypothetical protein